MLLAGIGRGPFIAIAPVLERRGLEIKRTAGLEEAIDLAVHRRFDLVVFDAEPDHMTMEEIVDRLRDRASASCDSSVLVMAAPDSVEAATELIGRGVNRVLSIVTAEEVIERHVADLLSVAPRVAVRCTTRLTTFVKSGGKETIGCTVNVSASGMLIETAAEVAIGTELTFNVQVTDGVTVKGTAVVVRRAESEREGVHGIAVQIVDFTGSADERYAALLADCVGPP